MKLEGCYSDWANALRGVPQGSILGPLLFLLYVNDLPDVVTKCTVNMYAGDVAIYFASKDVNEVADSLNEDLSHIATWIDMNRLKINVGKTQLITLGGQSFKPKWQQVDVQLHGTTIPERDSVRYLGLAIDKDLSWKTHVSNVRKKAFAAIGCIRRASQYLLVKIHKMLYNSLVLPHLDYLLFNSVALLQSYTLPEPRAYTKLCNESHSQPPPRTRSAPSETSFTGLPSIDDVTTKCCARCTGVCFSRLLSTSPGSLPRTHNSTHPPKEQTRYTPPHKQV